MPTNNLVVISDLHAGCKMGLHPDTPTELDDGGAYTPSDLQLKVWAMWQEFWDKWVPIATRGDPYSVVVNGDCIDGVHHNSTTQVSHNLADQVKIARAILEPVVERCDGRFYVVRGTEAHVGKSGTEEERLARDVLNAIPNEAGQHARHELWIRVGRGLVHIMHHIGTTGSSQYESSAIMKELAESYAEAGRWNRESPNVIVRSHRHRHLEVRVPTEMGYGISFCTAGWQLKTPFTYRIAGGRITTPQIGGSVIRQGDQDLYTRHKVWTIDRPAEEVA